MAYFFNWPWPASFIYKIQLLQQIDSEEVFRTQYLLYTSLFQSPQHLGSHPLVAYLIHQLLTFDVTDIWRIQWAILLKLFSYNVRIL